MATKPSWDGKYNRFCKMMRGNGYEAVRQTGSHVMWVNEEGKNILAVSGSHLTTGCAWQIINHNNLRWRAYI